ncbi:unnamed protein product [Symbiodinium sp. KB8]|nr:unnamed protein product [Symbiodinium sp. KB8]
MARAASDEKCLAAALEACATVRSRFRRELPWLQWPIPGREAKPGPASSSKDPHFPCTRALELNAAVLHKMLDVFTGEFVDIAYLTGQVQKLFDDVGYVPPKGQDPQVAELFRRVEAIRANIAAQEMEVQGDAADEADLYEDDVMEGDDGEEADGMEEEEAAEGEADVDEEAAEGEAHGMEAHEEAAEGGADGVEAHEAGHENPVHRYRSKRSLETVSELASPTASAAPSEFSIPPEMSEEQKEELAKILEQINRLTLESFDLLTVMRKEPAERSPTSTVSPTPSVNTTPASKLEVRGPCIKTNEKVEEPISPDQVDMPSKVAVTVTPAMQREKAADKRMKGRRGPGKRGPKAKRVRAAADSGARSSTDTVDVGTRVSIKKGKAKGKAKKVKPAAAASGEVDEPTEPKEEPVPAHDAEAVEPRRRRGRKAKVPEGESADHDVQQHIWLSDTRWVYQILPNQKFGCGGCRFLWFGCKSCQKETFRGRNCNQMKKDPAYIAALAAATGDAPEEAAEAVDEAAVAPEPARAKRAKKAKKHGSREMKHRSSPSDGHADVVFTAFEFQWCVASRDILASRGSAEHGEVEAADIGNESLAPAGEMWRGILALGVEKWLGIVLMVSVVLLAYTGGLQWDEVYDAIDVFAGKAVLTHALLSSGYATATLDILHWSQHVQHRLDEGRLLLSTILRARKFARVKSAPSLMYRYRKNGQEKYQGNSKLKESQLLTRNIQKAMPTGLQSACTGPPGDIRRFPAGSLFEDTWLDAKMYRVLAYLRGGCGLQLPDDWHNRMPPIPIKDRGSSFLAEQQAKNAAMTGQQVLEAAKRRLEEMRKASPEAASSGMTPDPKAFKKAPAEKKDAQEGGVGRPKKACVRTEEEKKAAALDAGLRRICTPKAKTGKLDVAPEVYQQWKKGGTERKLLLEHFIQAGADKDAFIKRIEHIRTKSRRDKYQKKLKEYWVDVSTQGTFQKTSEEVFREQLSGEGMADDITVGGVNPGEPLDASSGESSAGEDESDDDADSGAGKPRKGGRGKGNGNAKTSIEEEKALEAVENVGAVMTNILRTQGKMEDLTLKLQALKTAEIMKLHDKMADLKSYFDGHGAMSPECSRAMMEDTKLKRTLLRPKTKPPSQVHGVPGILSGSSWLALITVFPAGGPWEGIGKGP